MKIQSYARRIRELAEEGWDIKSNMTIPVFQLGPTAWNR